MIRVKICGITSDEDARHAAACGADALGFVLFPGSPRYLPAERVREIVAGLPPFVTAVGLFVNETPERVRETAEFCRLDAVQLHGDEPPADCRIPGRRVLKALRVRDAQSVAAHGDYADVDLLLDAWSPESFGGTGRSFDWELAAEVARRRPLVLAGGLTPENVAEAVRTVRPWGVDVSSGVEAAPGKKDPGRVADFIRAARGALGD